MTSAVFLIGGASYGSSALFAMNPASSRRLREIRLYCEAAVSLTWLTGEDEMVTILIAPE